MLRKVFLLHTAPPCLFSLGSHLWSIWNNYFHITHSLPTADLPWSCCYFPWGIQMSLVLHQEPARGQGDNDSLSPWIILSVWILSNYQVFFFLIFFFTLLGLCPTLVISHNFCHPEAFPAKQKRKINTVKLFHQWPFSLHYDVYQYQYLDAQKLIPCSS